MADIQNSTSVWVRQGTFTWGLLKAERGPESKERARIGSASQLISTEHGRRWAWEADPFQVQDDADFPYKPNAKAIKWFRLVIWVHGVRDIRSPSALGGRLLPLETGSGEGVEGKGVGRRGVDMRAMAVIWIYVDDADRMRS